MIHRKKERERTSEKDEPFALLADGFSSLSRYVDEPLDRKRAGFPGRLEHGRIELATYAAEVPASREEVGHPSPLKRRETIGHDTVHELTQEGMKEGQTDLTGVLSPEQHQGRLSEKGRRRAETGAQGLWTYHGERER
jgi:hypothetical protein